MEQEPLEINLEVLLTSSVGEDSVRYARLGEGGKKSKEKRCVCVCRVVSCGRVHAMPHTSYALGPKAFRFSLVAQLLELA